MQLHTYLFFGGNCEEAFRYYEKHLGATYCVHMSYEDAPTEYDMPDGWEKKVMHSTLTVGDTVLMGSDVSPKEFQKLQGFSVSATVADPEEAERIFQALADGGTVMMPFEETFWAKRFGMVYDRFGTPWMISCE